MFGHVLDADELQAELDALVAEDIIQNEEAIPDAPINDIKAPAKPQIQ